MRDAGSPSAVRRLPSAASRLQRNGCCSRCLSRSATTARSDVRWESASATKWEAWLGVLRRQDRVHLLTQPAEHHGLQRRDRAQDPPRPCDCRVRDRDEHGCGEDPGERSEPTVARYRRLGPIEEAIGLHARTDVGSCQRELLPKIQRRAELLDGLLSRLNLGGIGGRRQPACKRVLAGTRSRQREQLEQRAAAEQIEIVRVDVTIVAKSIAGLAGPYPAVLEPGQTALVKSDSPDVPRRASEGPGRDDGRATRRAPPEPTATSRSPQSARREARGTPQTQTSPGVRGRSARQLRSAGRVQHVDSPDAPGTRG